MKIAIASDHTGFEVKRKLKEYLLSKGYEVEDFGPNRVDPQDDYPDFGLPAVRSIEDKSSDKAILICSNGIGMSILANRIKGIRAALVYSETSARKSRNDDNSNVLCLGAQEFLYDRLQKFVDLWLNTEFEGGRHERRLSKIP